MARINYFVPGKGEKSEGPLARYLQPMPAGVAAAYIEAYTEPGQIVLDAFCQDETILREAVQIGRKAIGVNFNPLTVLVVRSRLTWPDSHQLDTGFTRLSNSPKMGMRLQEHLEALYSTLCAYCQHPVVADYFIWDRELEQPVEKGYRCEVCGSQGLARVDSADLEALDRIEKHRFHYWYIMDRVAPRGEDSREQAQRLLGLYTPRNLYALTSLLIKIEALFPQPPLQDAFKVILLACLDSCSNLHAAEDRAHPHRLHPPARFLELNVWQAFEAAYREARLWSRSPEVRLAGNLEEILAPNLLSWAKGRPPNTFLEARTARSLARELPKGRTALIAISPPRLDPTFWSLSYLWSGWLLGPEAATALKPLLGRKRADWAWYHRAMTTFFRALRDILQTEGRLVLALATETPAMLEALLFAASGAGFEMENLLYQPDDGGQYRLSFVKTVEPLVKPPMPDLEALADEIRHLGGLAAKGVLKERGEPLALSWLRNAIYGRLSRAGYLHRTLAVEEEDFSPLDFVAEQVEAAIEEADLIRLDAMAIDELRTPLWWLRKPEEVAAPLSDRVEEAIYQILQDSLILNRQALNEAIYPRFPGFLTPEEALIEACLESYAEEITPGHWRLREEDRETYREEQRMRGATQLIRLGRRLGYRVWANPVWQEMASAVGKGLSMSKGLPTEPFSPRPGDPQRSETEQLPFDPGPLARFDVLWHEEAAIHAFLLATKATLAHLLKEETKDGEVYRYLVIPSERISLIEFKLRRNPLLQKAMADGHWQIIKYCHLAWLAEAEEIDHHDLKKIVGLRPIIEQPEAQIPLL